MSFLRIDLDTTHKIFNQLTNQFVVPDANHESFVGMLVKDLLARLRFEIDRTLLGQVLVLQDRFGGNLEQILNIDDYPEEMSIYCDHRMVIEKFKAIKAHVCADMLLMRLIAELYGKPYEQLVADVSELFNTEYAAVCGIKYPALAEQYHDLIINVLLVALGLLIYNIALAAQVALLDKDRIISLPEIVERIANNTLDLAGVPEISYKAFRELIYDPLVFRKENHDELLSWCASVPDCEVIDYFVSESNVYHIQALLYHKYGPQAVSQAKTSTALAMHLDAVGI